MFGKISLKYKMILLAILIIFAFPQKIHAEEAELQYYYLEFHENGEAVWRSKSLCFQGFHSVEEKAFLLFEDFFGGGLAAAVPEGTRVLSVTLDEGLLVLNVSGEIKNYGGTENELNLMRQILKTAFEIPSVQKVTLLIEGMRDYLPEGSMIEEQARENLDFHCIYCEIIV